jgi:Recombinase
LRDNVEIMGANGQRSHVERRINDAEAAIVRQIFEGPAAGAGLTRIAKDLNAAGALTPRPQQGRPAGWAPSTVREVLLRALYCGEIVWNQSRKRDTWGRAQRSERPEESWLRRPAPELRIVSPELWSASQRADEARGAVLDGRAELSRVVLPALRVRLAQSEPRQAARAVLRVHSPLEARAGDVRQRRRENEGNQQQPGAREIHGAAHTRSNVARAKFEWRRHSDRGW